MKAVLQILNFDKKDTFLKVKELLKDRTGITEVRIDEITGRIVLDTKSFNSLEGAIFALNDSRIDIVEVKKNSSVRTNRLH